MVKYCTNCGAELKDDDSFCPKCGNKLDDYFNNQNNSINKQESILSIDKKVFFTDTDETIIIQSLNNFIGYILTPSLIIIVLILLMQIRFLILFLFMIPFIIWLVLRIIAYDRNELILTNKRITGKLGLINTKQMDSPLNQISAVSVDSGLFGKIFNYKTVTITTSYSIHKFKFITNGEILHHSIVKEIQNFKNEKIMKQAQAIADSSKN